MIDFSMFFNGSGMIDLVSLRSRLNLIVRQYGINIVVGGCSNIPHCFAMVIEAW